MLFKNASKSISLGVPIDGSDPKGITGERGISLQENTDKLVAQYPDRALKVIRSWMAIN